jgi:hypothetical protein
VRQAEVADESREIVVAILRTKRPGFDEDRLRRLLPLGPTLRRAASREAAQALKKHNFLKQTSGPSAYANAREAELKSQLARIQRSGGRDARTVTEQALVEGFAREEGQRWKVADGKSPYVADENTGKDPILGRALLDSEALPPPPAGGVRQRGVMEKTFLTRKRLLEIFKAYEHLPEPNERELTILQGHLLVEQRLQEFVAKRPRIRGHSILIGFGSRSSSSSRELSMTC